MKKQLLLVNIVMLFALLSHAQIFDNESFESYDEGNFFSDVNPGFSIGPNQWRAYAYDDNMGGDHTSNNLGVENFQIVNHNGSKAIKLQSPNNNTGFRTLFKSGFKQAWEQRDASNNVLKMDFDITIAETVAESRVQVYAVASAENNYKILAGVSFYTGDKSVKGLIRLLNPDDNEEYLALMDLEAIPYEAGHTYAFTCAYNTDNKEVTWICEALDINKTEVGFTDVEPAEVDVFLSYLNMEANPTEVYLDNFKQSFTDAHFLGVNDVESSSSTLHIYPNPATDFIVVNLAQPADRATKIQICDLQGRVLIQQNHANEIGISTLAKGMYILKVTTTNRSYTKPFLKK